MAILDTLYPAHPRLFLHADEIDRVRDLAENDPLGREYYALLLRDGEKMLGEPPVERVLVGREPSYMYMLLESRRAVHRITTLSLLYRLTGERRWADRAIEEMLSAARFVDWNPAHFLDVAEMINALATGYDWLFDVLTPEQRVEIREALVEKGLKQAEIGYFHAPDGLRRGRAGATAWWAVTPFNWNNVCNSGILIGALALADELPELAETLIGEAVKYLPLALASYAPDGAWAEGPGYWGYATHYTTLGFAALLSALGTDFGLSELPGLPEAGAFRMHGAGPTGRFFNFADAAEDSAFDPSFYYLAARYNRPEYAQAAETSLRIGQAEPRCGAYASALIWYDPQLTRRVAPQLPLDAHYENAHLAFFRSSWTDPDAYYVGFKGGDNKANHSHLDLGSFVFDALGSRWVSDLCGDEYTLPGYWETRGRRWGYYRLGTAGHNTLQINGLNQDPAAEAPITAFACEEESGSAVADLTAAYAPAGVKQVTRAVSLSADRSGRPRSALTIDDIVIASAPVPVEWRVHTTAQVETQGATALLRQDGKTMLVRILQPEGAVFTAEPALTEPPQKPLAGMTRLVIRLENQASARIVVRFEEAQPVRY